MPEPLRYRGRPTSPPPQMRRVLVVDDNDHYARALSAHARGHGAREVVRARSAAEGIALLGPECAGFDCVITDISMERELAGLAVIAHANRCGYAGVLATATTALDSWYGFAFNRLVFGLLYRTDFMIPKRPIRREDRVLWVPSIGTRSCRKAPLAGQTRPASQD